MTSRNLLLALAVGGTIASGALAQNAPSTAPGGIDAAVAKEVKGLTSDEFPEREAAL